MKMIGKPNKMDSSDSMNRMKIIIEDGKPINKCEKYIEQPWSLIQSYFKDLNLGWFNKSNI